MKFLSETERNTFIEIITQITGAAPLDEAKINHFSLALKSLMKRSNCKSFVEYLNLVDRDSTQFARFLSAITNHTTSWFRESVHFSKVEDIIERRLQKTKDLRIQFRIWSTACSTGQEVYSLALLMENIRQRKENFDYFIEGSDLDPISIKKARRAIYSVGDIAGIPEKYRSLVYVGHGEQKDWFTLSPEIRKRCHFSLQNLAEPTFPSQFSSFDLIFCRNVLIYFDQTSCARIISNLSKCLSVGGALVLGHSDASPELVNKTEGLEFLGSSVFRRKEIKPKKSAVISLEQKRPSQVARDRTVLIVEDLPVIRTLLRTKLEKMNFKVVECENTVDAEKILKTHKIDLISLDLNLPGKSGAEWLRDLRKSGVKLPVIIVSASDPENARELYGAFEFGAQEYFLKEELTRKLKSYCTLVDALTSAKAPQTLVVGKSEISLERQAFCLDKSPEVIVIGASTGGPEAIWNLIRNVKRPSPPIVIVQHTSSYFASHFAETLAKHSGLPMGGKLPDQVLKPDTVYAAQGDWHLAIEKIGVNLVLKHLSTPQQWGHRPAVDVLFKSVASQKIPAIAVLLTGMGVDGAEGMKDLAAAGSCYNIAQSQESCIVYGMPREAMRFGAVHFSGDISQIRNKIESILLSTPRSQTVAAKKVFAA